MDRALDISNINIKRAYGLWTLLILNFILPFGPGLHHKPKSTSKNHKLFPCGCCHPPSLSSPPVRGFGSTSPFDVASTFLLGSRLAHAPHPPTATAASRGWGRVKIEKAACDRNGEEENNDRGDSELDVGKIPGTVCRGFPTGHFQRD